MPTVAEIKQAAVAAIESRKEEIVGLANAILRSPETGFTEHKTSRLVQEQMGALGIPFQGGLALTGVKGVVEGKAGPGPSVAILGELDSLRLLDHPFHDASTGGAHACGHHCQIASMVGAMVGLTVPQVINHLSGRIIPMAVPAEEFIEVEQRMGLREQGKIEFLGGKQELIKLGAFDDVDMAMLCHTTGNGARLMVGGTSNGHLAKFVRFTGRSAHAGGAPYRGINALNAATLAISAMHANRETFRGRDTVRVHGIITRGGDSVSAVPANVTLEWRVRSGNLDALLANSARVDRCLKAGALAVGARVTITNIPGYLPMRNNALLQESFVQNAYELVEASQVRTRRTGQNGGGSTDMGDLSQILPVIHPYCGGATGTSHGRDYVIEDYETAVVLPAKVMAMTTIDLLANGAAKAQEVKAKDRPPMTKEQYLKFQRQQAQVIHFDGARH